MDFINERIISNAFFKNVFLYSVFKMIDYIEN